MANRKYSVDEIDKMRGAVVALVGEKYAEEHLRTHMLHGTDPTELEEAGHQRAMARFHAQCEAHAFVSKAAQR